MIIDTLQVHQTDEWSVVLFRSHERPQRFVVAVERELWQHDGAIIDQWCIGWSDDAVEAQALFDATVRSLADSEPASGPHVGAGDSDGTVRVLVPQSDHHLDLAVAA